MLGLGLTYILLGYGHGYFRHNINDISLCYGIRLGYVKLAIGLSYVRLWATSGPVSQYGRKLPRGARKK